MVYSWERAERDLREAPERLPRGIQHVAWSIDPTGGGSDVDFVGEGESDLELHLVPIVNLASPMRATRLMIFAGASHLIVAGVQIQMSIWRVDSPLHTTTQKRGRWSVKLLGRTSTARVERLSSDDTRLDWVALPLQLSVLLEPPQVYFLGLQVNEAAGGSLVVRCPQGVFSASARQFLSARKANVQPSRLGDYPTQVTPGVETQHFFAAALSDQGYQHFLRQD